MPTTGKSWVGCGSRLPGPDMDAFRDWFNELAPRERVLVSAAGLLLVFAILVLGAVRPLISKAARNAEIVADREALLAELDDVAARLGPQQGGGNAAGSFQFVSCDC